MTIHCPANICEANIFHGNVRVYVCNMRGYQCVSIDTTGCIWVERRTCHCQSDVNSMRMNLDHSEAPLARWQAGTESACTVAGWNRVRLHGGRLVPSPLARWQAGTESACTVAGWNRVRLHGGRLVPSPLARWQAGTESGANFDVHRGGEIDNDDARKRRPNNGTTVAVITVRVLLFPGLIDQIDRAVF